MAKSDKKPVRSAEPNAGGKEQRVEGARKMKLKRPKRDPEVENDERFKGIRRDPRFRPFRAEERKIKVDDRFKAMLTDPKFNLTHKVDPRGRPAKVKSSAENMRKFYALEEDRDSSDEEAVGKEGEEGKTSKIAKKKKEKQMGAEESDEEHDEEKPDYARGEGQLQSSSSEDESSSDEESDAASDLDDVEHPWNELDADAPRTEEDIGATRLAVCNMDWDRVTAKDLVVALSSFLPNAGATVKSVKIYKSEFGKQRMAVEEVSGPSELKDVKAKPKEKTDAKDSDEDSDDEVMREKVRQYQLNRLKYYYAVADFDSQASANHVYEQCDGVEYESSATRFDLRLIPEGETFDEADVVDSCTPQQLDLEKYKPHLFTNTALQQGKVRCTWDETDPKREKTIETIFKSLNPKSKKEKKAMKKAGKPADIDGLNEDDWRAYLASDTSDEEPEEGAPSANEGNVEESKKTKKDRLAAYKELLNEIKSKEAKEEKEKAHMEISWHPVDVEPVKELVEKKKEEAKAETPWDRYLAKLKEKKKQKKPPKEGEDGEAENPSSELTREELNDPFFASSNLNDEDQYDPMKMFKSGAKKEKTKKNKSDEKQEDEEKEDGEELDLLAMDVGDDESSKRHFNLDRIMKIEKLKAKKKLYKKDKKKLQELGSGDGDGFAVNVADPRFGAVYSSHNFNVDPSDPLFKPTPGMKAILDEKRKRRVENPERVVEKGGEKSEISSLVQSVKRKAVASKFKPKRGKFEKRS